MKAIKTAIIPLCLAALSMTGLAAYAETAEEKGLAIAKEQKSRNTGWQDSTSEMKMTLRTANGRENVRYIKVKSLEVQDDGDKSLMVFDQPKDVKGTSFLTFSHVDKPDDQWIYLPALKRIKRISSKKKSGSFMGSEFSYEDLSSFELEKYDFKYLKDESFNEKNCFVVEQTPRDKYSGYSRVVQWIDQDDYQIQKVEFFDKRNELLKTMVVESYEKFNDKYWRATKSLMQNVQTGKSTLLESNGIQIATGLSPEEFSKNALKSSE